MSGRERAAGAVMVACAVTVGSFLESAAGAVIKEIEVDEYGHMAVRYQHSAANPDVFLTGGLMSDAGLPGAIGEALTFVLPFSPAAGDLVIQGEDGNAAVARFVPAGYVAGVDEDRLIFYAETSPILAGTGLPELFISISETGENGKPIVASPQFRHEGGSDMSNQRKTNWTLPNGNSDTDPGFFENEGHPFKYVFYTGGTEIPDWVPVPEPAGLSLLALGFVAARRRQPRRAA